MSKTFSLAGIRVGAVIADMKIIDIINQQRQYNTISVSALDDYVANFALKNKDKIIERNLDIILKGKLILENWAKKQAKIKISKLEAGTTAFLKYQDSRNSYDFSLDLFKDTGVLVLPGDTMEIPKHIRIGYCGDVDTLQKGLKLFGAWLNKE
jgi:aspartate/methionine/tyrosine aminotransferase